MEAPEHFPMRESRDSGSGTNGNSIAKFNAKCRWRTPKPRRKEWRHKSFTFSVPAVWRARSATFALASPLRTGPRKVRAVLDDDSNFVRVRRQGFIAHDPPDELRPRVSGQSSHPTELVPVVSR